MVVSHSLKNPLISRRDTLNAVLGGMAALTLRQSSLAQGGGLSTTKLADNFSLITGAGSTVLVQVSPEGCLLVDCGSPERSPELLKAVGELSGNKPVRVLFDTHWHYESTGGNETLGKAGSKIIAHENTKLWLTTEIDQQWTKREFTPLPKIAWPNETFYTTGKTTLVGPPVEYGYLAQAHTDGDIYIHFPNVNILMAGDAVQPGRFPVLDWTTGGWITGMVDAQKVLLGVATADTRIVPASGPVMTKAELQTNYDKLTALRDLFLKNFRMGKSPQDMLSEDMVKDFADWGDPKQFMSNCYRGMWGHVREVGGIV